MIHFTYRTMIQNTSTFLTPALYLMALMLLMTGMTACSDLISDTDDREIVTLLIANEGNFSDGNGSITGFDPDNGEIVQERFQKVNGRPLAGIIQSITVSGDRLFIVSNNINKIEKTYSETLESIATIEAGEEFAPAGFALSDNGKAYVSHLFDNAVYVVDMEEYRVTDVRIPTGNNPQEMLVYGNRLYVANNGFGMDNRITVIDTATDEVTGTLEVGAGPFAMHKDNEGRIWVVCSGNKAYDMDWNRDPDNDTFGRIDVLNAAGGDHIATVETGGFPKAIALDEASARAWVVNENAVQRVDMNTYELLDADYISRGFNGIGYSEVEELFYLAQSRGYTQNGQAIRYNPEGAAVDSFSTGIAPMDFVFHVE